MDLIQYGRCPYKKETVPGKAVLAEIQALKQGAIGEPRAANPADTLSGLLDSKAEELDIPFDNPHCLWYFINSSPKRLIQKKGKRILEWIIVPHQEVAYKNRLLQIECYRQY